MNLFYSALSTLIISSNSFAFPSLESDLANQFARYESTKQYLQEQILIKKKHVSSIEIDNIIGNGLTPENQRNLYKKHNEIILKAKKKAQKNSLINFDNLRKIPHKIQQLCKQFPKGGNLHVHPNGAITHETVKRLLRLKDFSFQSYQDSRFSFKGNKSYNNMSQNDQSIAQAQFCLPRDVVTFSEFAQIFPITKKLVDGGTFSPMAYEAYKSYLLDAKKQGIRYVEFIKGFPLDKKSLSRLDQMAISLEKETGVIPRWQISYYRGGVNSSLAKKIIKSFTQNKSTAIVGINIVGDETYTPAMEHTQEFYVAISNAKKRFKNDSFGLTMHAGEMGQIKNVRDAVLLGSERIGHGVSLINDPLTLEYVRKQKLPVEISLESNRRLGVVKSLATHPFINFLRLGLKVSLSTDDDGILETNPNRECVLAISNSDIQYNELKNIYKNSILTAFIDSKTKKSLLKQLNIDFKNFEINWMKK